MTFEVPPSKASIGQNQWPFKMPKATQPDVEAAKEAAPELFAEFEAAREKWAAHQAQHVKPATRLSVPKLQFLRPSLMREMDTKANRIDRVYMLLEHYHPGLVDQFDGLDQIEAFYTAWAEGSGLSVGESSASSTS